MICGRIIIVSTLILGKESDMENELLSVGELAYRTKVSIRTIDRYRISGLIKATCMVSRRYMYSTNTVNEVLHIFASRRKGGVGR
jgi:hypothetical protein